MSKLLLAAVLALQLLQVAANAECIDCGSERIKPVRTLPDASYCQFPGACDRSTPGTGHKNFTGNLTEDLITVERCYSFCFKNFSSSSGSAVDPFPDIFTGDPCSDNTDAFVCYSACLFSAKDTLERILPEISVPDNATCEHYCTLKGGICERAFPPNSSCVLQCKLETCHQYCKLVKERFPKQSNPGPVSTMSAYFTIDFASNISLKRQGVLEVQLHLSGTGATPADESVLGLIWKVTHYDGAVDYIPHHLPFILLPDEVGPLYRIGSNMLAIRDLQCISFLVVESAVVTQFGVGNFSRSSPYYQCFYGNWHPRPPADINMTLGYSRETGDLKFEVTAQRPSPDEEYVTGYGVQVLGLFDDNIADCSGETGSPRATGSITFQNKSDLHLVVDNNEGVLRLLPGANGVIGCAYWIGVYALPQKEFNAAGQPILFRGGYWQQSYVSAPKFPYATWNQTFDLKRDRVTGLTDVTYTLTLTSHWKSLAVLSSIRGFFSTVPHDQSHVVIKHYNHKIRVTPSVTRYKFVFPRVPPIQDSVGEYRFHINYVKKEAFDARSFIYKKLFTPGVVLLPPHPPSPPRNLTFNFYLDFESNKLRGNATWIGPEMPEGKLIEYRYVLNSVIASTIVGGTLSVENTPAATDMSVENFVTFSADLTEQDYFNFSVQAVSEWGASLAGVGTYGEWANVTVYPEPVITGTVTIANLRDITTQNDLQDKNAVFTFDMHPRISPDMRLGYRVQIQWSQLKIEFGGYNGNDTYYLPPKSIRRCGGTPNTTLELVGAGSFKLTVPRSALSSGPLSISVSVSLVCLQRTSNYCPLCTRWRYTSQMSSNIEISAKRGSLAPFEVDLKLWPKEECFEAAGAIKATDVSSILIRAIHDNVDDIADTSYLQVYGGRYLCERKGYLSFRGVLVNLNDFVATKNRDTLHDWLEGGARHIVVADRWMNIKEGACGIALTSLEDPACD